VILPWLTQIAADGSAALASHPDAVAYLFRRGVLPEEFASHQLGMLPADYPLPPCTAEFAEWQKWYLRGRLLFPITATIGDVVGLQTRALHDKKHQMFYGASRDVFVPAYGIGPAATLMYERQQVVVVEGMFDYFAVRRAGVENVVALMTSHSNRALNKMLGRYCKRVIALLDMDAAGRGGVNSLLYDQTFEVVAPVYPANDPADLIQMSGGLQLLTALVAPAKERYGLWV
jgi:DNA primase